MEITKNIAIQKEIEFLAEELGYITSKARVYINCSDGSYEMALYTAGFWDVKKKLDALVDSIK